MVKVFITDNKSKNVSAAIISGLKRQVNELNSAEYNYADILKSVTLFKEYSRLLSAYFGIEVNVSFNIQHSSKAKVNTVSNIVPKVRLNDLNAALRSNYNMLIQIVGQIESIYNKAYADYKTMVALYDSERLEYNGYIDDASSEIDSLTEALNNTEIVTEEEITEALNEAQAETESQIEETETAVDNTAQEVWDTNKGYETSSQIQEDAIKAAEEYAENNAQAHAASEAEAKLSEANSELSKAEEAMNIANDEWDKAASEAEKAQAERLEADADYRSELGHVNGLINAINNTEDYDPGKTNIGDLTAGTYLSEDGNTVTSVTHNGDGTTTITTESSDGTHTSVTYFDTDNAQSTYNSASEKSDQAAQAAQAAAENAEQKQAAANEAYDKLTESLNDYRDAATKAQEAQNAYDDASIQYATDDELETGWQNDPDNPSDDDYGEDNWGDWSDIIGEGIDDDSEETDD